MMRNVLKILLPVLVLFVGTSGAWWLVVNRKAVAPQPTEKFKPLVELALVKLGAYTPEVVAQGTVMAEREIGLSPEVGGRVEWVSPNLLVGGLFDEGEELVRIDASDYQLALRQATADIQSAQASMTNALAQVSSAEAQVAQAQARIAREQAEADAARAEWKLLGREGEPPELVLREPQLREARAAMASAEALMGASRAQHESGRAALAAAEAARDQAQVNLGRCILKAPFGGRVKSQSVGIGQVVSRTSVLARLQPVAVAEVRLLLPMQDLERLGLGGSLRGGGVEGPKVLLKAGDAEWTGHIIRTEGEVQASTRMMAVIVSVPGPYAEGKAALSFGRFVVARIQGRPLPQVVLLPRAALREGDAVYVFREGRLHRREVKVGWGDRDRVAVSGGLQNGDRVCLSPLDTFVEGMEVRTDE